MNRAFPAILLSLVCVLPSRAADAPHAALDSKHRAFFKDYCTECHNEKKQKGKLRLDDISFTLDSVENADRWQKILNQINSGEMPPEDAKQPERVAKTEFLDSLSHTLMAARRSLGDVGGKITMRRLNRREYKNTIRDLLGVDINVRELPADGGAGTFDTVGSSLFMSSDQFEQYLALGRQALDEHFARFVAPSGAKLRLMHVEAEERNARIAKSLAERTDAHERFVKWTTAVDVAAQRPENTDSAANIRAEKKGDDRHFYSQWQRIKGAPSPKDFGFVDEIHADEQGRRNWVRSVPYQRAYLEHPATKTGTFLTIEDVFVNPYQPFRLPGDWPAGDYVVRVRIAATSNTPASRHFVEFGSQHDSGVRAVASSHQITGTMEHPQVLEIPLKFSPAKGYGFFFQEKGTYESEDVAHRLFAEGQKANGIGPEFALWIDWIEVASATSAPTLTKTDAPKPQKMRKDPEQWANKYMPIYAEGFVEKYSRFQKWCAAIDDAAKKSENADIAKKLRDDPKVKQSPHLFYNHFAEFAGAPPPTQFGFKDVDDAQFARSEYSYHHQYYADYSKLPQRETGAWLMLYSLGRYTGITAPANWPAGKYTLRVRLAASDESPKERRFIEIGTGKADAADFNVLSSHQVNGTLASPQTLEIPVEINASGDRNFAIRDKRPNKREAEYAMFREAWDKTGTGPRPCIWVDFVELEGPVNTATPAAQTVAQTFKTHIEPETQANKEISQAIVTADKAMERYQQWTAAVDKIAALAEHAEVVKEICALPVVKSRPSAFYQEWAKRRTEPSAKSFGFPDADEAEFQRGQYRKIQYARDYLALPNKDTGSCLTTFHLHPMEKMAANSNWPAGTYRLRIRAGRLADAPKERCFLQVGQPDSKQSSISFSLISTHQVTGTVDKPEIIEVPLSLGLDGNRTFAVREKADLKTANYDVWIQTLEKTGTGPKPALWIDWMELEGPVSANAPTLATNAVAKTTRIEPETRRAEVERGHLRYKFLNEQYGKWKAAGGDEAKLKDFGFTDKSHAEFAKVVWDSNNHWFQQYLDRPLSKTGLYLDNTVQETSEHAIDLPADLPTGDYVFRVNIGCVPDMPKERAFLSFVKASPIDKDDRTLLETRQITADLAHPQTIELPFRIEPNGARKFIFMEKRPLKKEAISLPGRTRQMKDAKQRDPVLWIDWIEWQGPLLKQQFAPLVKTHRYEPERKTAELKQKIVSMNDNHEKYQQWKASGGNKEDVSKYGFQSDKQADIGELAWQGNHDWFQRYVDRPKAETGMFFDNTINETSEFLVDLPRELATGDYVFRVKVGRVPDMPMERAFLSLAQVNPIDNEARTFVTSRQITADYDHPDVVELPFRCVSGGSRRFIFAERRPLIRIDFGLAGKTRLIEEPKQRDPVLWIDWIEWEGPLNKSGTQSAPAQVVFANAANASEREHARAVIERFAVRAFRDKPPTDAYLAKLTALYDARRKAGDSFEVALKTPLSVVVASPRFLYLSEPAEEKKPRPLTAPELATRLSYFLWSAPPDDTLLALARSGDLMNPDVLAHEVDRMLTSEKANEFVSGFVHQWLGMERLDFFQFDTKQFRDFDESAKASARREVYETFAHLLHANGSARDLLKCDYVIVNGLLATYYGIDGVSGDEFRKVSLPKDSPRGGLLGMAAVLAMGSNGERTSPVERGAWVLRKLLHDPPPPAPPNVPQITRLNGQPLTTRERLLAHQEEPQCASCHRAIDPIGFGLENFNAAGKWRTKDSFQAIDANGRPAKNGLKTWTIDPAAAFHKGPAFKDYFELRDLIAAKPEKFARGLTEALIQYALGRPFGFADEELATNIVQAAQQKDFAMREFIVALASSRAFQIK